MSFLYPLGLLALLAIPVLILIYIIKNRYTEQTVTSTYLWELSEKFLRRRIPINKLTGIISLILQILAVVLIALIVAHPILSIPGGANEYCFILDASGSMNIQMNGSTRFEEGKKRIAEIIDGSMNGSTYTLICVGDTVYKSTTFSDKELALETLYGESFEVSYSNANPNEAITLANAYYSEHPAAVVYLVTDRTYETMEHVEPINVLGGDKNYSVSDVKGVTAGADLTIEGNVTSYGSDVEKITLNVYFSEGVDETTGEMQYRLDGAYDITAEEGNIISGEEVHFELKFAGMAGYEAFKLTIVQTDALALDNEVIVYNVHHENFDKTLVIYGKTEDIQHNQMVYKEPNFLLWGLRAAGNNQIVTVTDEEYASNAKYRSGYGLYIFNDCPTVDDNGQFIQLEMPTDGAVWIINPQNAFAGSNITVQNETVAKSPAQFSKSTNSSVKKMLEGVAQKEFELNKYIKLGINGTFTELVRCDGNPLLLTGVNANGNREVVFAFGLSASADFTLHADFTTILAHLLSYSFPEVLEETSYYCGDTLQINVVSGCTGIRIDPPSGGDPSYPETTNIAVAEHLLTETGIYTVTLIMKEGERTFYVYSSLPKEERVLTVVEQAPFTLNKPEGTAEKLPGIIDNLLIIFIILAVVAVADYGVYCYEQYQLR